ncbi:hypothetical protein V8B97DRAFT_1979571, partial [Scleroderma yunnanense]
MSYESDTPPLMLSTSSSPTSGSTGTLASFKDPCQTFSSLEKHLLTKETLQTPRAPTNKHQAESASLPRPISDHWAGQILEYISNKFQPHPRPHSISASEHSVHKATSSPMPTNIDMIECSEIYARGVAHMSTTLLKKAALAKEASREYQCQSLLTTAWKIEELRRYMEFMEGVQEEIKDCFKYNTEEFMLFKSLLSPGSPSEMRDERSRLLETYDVDVSELAAIDSQLDGLVAQLPV